MDLPSSSSRPAHAGTRSETLWLEAAVVDPAETTLAGEIEVYQRDRKNNRSLFPNLPPKPVATLNPSQKDEN
jgi:hypothetical protein